MNSTTLSTDHAAPSSTLHSTLAGIIAISLTAGICSLMTVFGNFFVILAFITNRSLRTFSNYLILNLAISDFIIGIFSMNMFAVYNVTEEWTMGSGMCKTWLTVDYIVSNTSVMNLLGICVDRYMAINCPVKYRKLCTTCMAVVIICMTWTISFLLWAPPILLWDVVVQNYTEPSKQGTCSIPFMENSAAVTIITAVGAFYLPATAMCTLYWRVIVKIERQTSGVSSMIANATQSMSDRYTRVWNPRQQIKVFFQKRDAASPTGIDLENPPVQNNAEVNGNIIINHGTKLQNDLITCDQPATALLSGERCSGSPNSLFAHHDGKSLKRENSRSASEAEASDSRPSVTKSEESIQPYERPASCIAENKAKNKTSKKYPRIMKRTSTTSILSKSTEMRLNREKRATTLLKSILICFISLWLPYNIIVVVSGLCASCDISSFMWKLSYWLCYLNSTANPFCYGYCNENFQRTFRALLTQKWWTRQGRRNMRHRVGNRTTVRRV